MGLFKKSFIATQLSKRNVIIKENFTENPNYFSWNDYIDLEHYSTYIVVKPRGIGTTHSGWQLIIDVYESSQEHTIWMRTSDTEIKEVIEDYKLNRPDPWPEWAIVKGRSLIDNRNGNLIAKFVALSTVGNLASITGNGCFGIFYDEFLKRTGRGVSDAFKKITDFIRTIERKHLATVMLAANLTTLNSDILTKWDLWIDEPEVDNKEKRLRWRYYREWENAPRVDSVSTAALWAQNDEVVRNFFEHNEVLDDSAEFVLPESRLSALRHYYMFLLDGRYITMSLSDEDQWVLVEGARISNGYVNVLTTVDGFSRKDRTHVRPVDLEQTIQPIVFALETKNLIFTDHAIKDSVFKFLQSIKGKYIRK